MNIDHLVKMANEIGSFFVTANDEDTAASLIADHLKRFWDPRMRRQVIGHLSQGGQGFTPAVAKAVGLLAASAGVHPPAIRR